LAPQPPLRCQELGCPAPGTHRSEASNMRIAADFDNFRKRQSRGDSGGICVLQIHLLHPQRNPAGGRQFDSRPAALNPQSEGSQGLTPQLFRLLLRSRLVKSVSSSWVGAPMRVGGEVFDPIACTRLLLRRRPSGALPRRNFIVEELGAAWGPARRTRSCACSGEGVDGSGPTTDPAGAQRRPGSSGRRMGQHSDGDYYDLLGGGARCRCRTHSSVPTSSLPRSYHPDVNRRIPPRGEDRFKGDRSGLRKSSSDSPDRGPATTSSVRRRVGGGGAPGMGDVGGFATLFFETSSGGFGGGARAAPPSPRPPPGRRPAARPQHQLQRRGVRPGGRRPRSPLGNCAPASGSGRKPAGGPTTVATCAGKQAGASRHPPPFGSFPGAPVPSCEGSGQVMPNPCGRLQAARGCAGAQNCGITIPAGVDSGTACGQQ